MKKNILPDWYSPSLYEEKLSIDQWITELDRRRRFYIAKFGLGFPLEDKELEILFERAIIKKEDGLFPLGEDYFIPPPIEDLPTQYRNLKPFDIVERNGKIVSGGGVIPLCVDMIHYSNDVLKEYFEKWLLSVRKEQAEGKHAEYFFGTLSALTGQKADEFNKYIGKKGEGATSYKKKDFDKWHKFKLLGVIDFILWGEVAGITYTNEFLNKTLYRDVSEGSRDKIANVKGWVYELFGAGGIEQLQGLCELEKTTSKEDEIIIHNIGKHC